MVLEPELTRGYSSWLRWPYVTTSEVWQRESSFGAVIGEQADSQVPRSMHEDQGLASAGRFSVPDSVTSTWRRAKSLLDMTLITA